MIRAFFVFPYISLVDCQSWSQDELREHIREARMQQRIQRRVYMQQAAPTMEQFSHMQLSAAVSNAKMSVKIRAGTQGERCVMQCFVLCCCVRAAVVHNDAVFLFHKLVCSNVQSRRIASQAGKEYFFVRSEYVSFL